MTSPRTTQLAADPASGATFVASPASPSKPTPNPIPGSISGLTIPSLYQSLIVVHIGSNKKPYAVHRALLVQESEIIADLFQDRSKECKLRLEDIIVLLKDLPKALESKAPKYLDVHSDHPNAEIAVALTTGIIGSTPMYLQNTEADLLHELVRYLKAGVNFPGSRDPTQLHEAEDSWELFSEAYYTKVWEFAHKNHCQYLNFLVDKVIEIATERLKRMCTPHHLPYSKVYNRPLEFDNVSEGAFDVFIHVLYTGKVECLNEEGSAMQPVFVADLVEVLSIAEQLRVPKVVKAIVGELDKRSVHEVLEMDMELVRELKGLLNILQEWGYDK